ncbi:MAG: diacylglycerol kinase family lipid kinase, partial [Nitrospirae bacterium]|nr:diacylglycerol kinase family lipid kinase [Nitrospirota bacterium]
MRTIFLIGNPAAGKNALRKINEAAAIIKNKGHNVEMLLTGKRGDAESLARQISSESGVKSPELKNDKNLELITHDSKLLIIAAGGDGTYNEVINGIACTNIPMAILPLGTTNVLAKELGISEDVQKALDIALSGRVQTVSLGKITARHLTSEDSSLAQPQASPDIIGITRYFLLMAGIGYDGETVYGIKDEMKRYSGKGAYILSGLRTLLRWAPDKLTFTMNGKSCEGYSAIICKTSKYAGNFRIAPDADITKKNFYALIMHGRSRADILKYVYGIVTGNHLKFKGITYHQAENIEVNGRAHVQIDGDYFGTTPAMI